MNYVIVNVGTEKLYRKHGNYSDAMYPTERGAKIACTKLNKEVGNCGQWAVMEYSAYRNAYPVKIKTVKNLMSGKDIQIPEDTPGCCDPSQERYWSM